MFWGAFPGDNSSVVPPSPHTVATTEVVLLFALPTPGHSVPDLLAPSPLPFLFPTRTRRGTDPIFDGSSAGMMTTDAAKGDALWWWFLPALVESASGFDAESDMPPTLIWLQGGPGAPSTYGELGAGAGGFDVGLGRGAWGWVWHNSTG